MTIEIAPQPHGQASQDAQRKLRRALRKTEDRAALAKLKAAFHDAERPGFRRVAMSARLMMLRMSLEDLHRTPAPKKPKAAPAAVAPAPESQPVPESAPPPAPKKVQKSKFAELDLNNAARLLAMESAAAAQPLTDPSAQVPPPEVASADADAQRSTLEAIDPAPANPQSGETPDRADAWEVSDAAQMPDAPAMGLDQPGTNRGATDKGFRPVSFARAELPTERDLPDEMAPDANGSVAEPQDESHDPRAKPLAALAEAASSVQRDDAGDMPASASAPAPTKVRTDDAAVTPAVQRSVAPDAMPPIAAPAREPSVSVPMAEPPTTAQDGPVADILVPNPAAIHVATGGSSARGGTEPPSAQTEPAARQTAPDAVSALAASDAVEGSRDGGDERDRGALPAPARLPRHETGDADGAIRADVPTFAAERGMAREPETIPIEAPAAVDSLENKVFRKPKKGTPMVNLDAMAALAAFSAAAPGAQDPKTDAADDDWLWDD
ncbi:hypothetical protein ACVDG3_15035 [Meridianimarinicoccus sp. RP-17]|uniref:hypothetical protein n=1 Tax=Meridianimarinicoccus zhengii TaxID=2056810 RepID=UPI000DAE327E|nr:hypothetical protein [Phycocomes zhengii]